MAATKWNKRLRQAVAAAAAALLAAEVLLVLASWLLTASTVTAQLPIAGVRRSLLSGQGLRWLAAHFAEGLQSPLLVWLLLAAVAAGILRRSQLLSARPSALHAQRLVLLLLPLAVYTLVVVLLVAPPHAVLLSATGHLWPSPFSRALVPIVCLGIIIAAVGYGLAARTLTSLTAITDAAVAGLRRAAPLLLHYILAMQLYLSLRYVLMIE